MSNPTNKRVLLFGGSFDPVHNGHLAMLRRADQEFNFDQIIIVPGGNAPHKAICESSELRVTLLKKALCEVESLKDKTIISTFEIEHATSVNYTIDTLNALCTDAATDYFLLIGADQFNLFHTWKDPEGITAKVKLIVIGRADIILEPKNIIRFQPLIITDFDYPMSSSAFRRLQSFDLPFTIFDYIFQKHAYFCFDLYYFLGDDKYQHSFNVMQLALKIYEANFSPRGVGHNQQAKDQTLSEERIIISALLHDIGKMFTGSITSLTNLLGDYTPKALTSFSAAIQNYDVAAYNHFIAEHTKDAETNCRHQFSGSYLAKKIFAIEDEAVVDAIRLHCSGGPQMSLLTKIIYAADKVDVRLGREGSESAFIKYQQKNNMLERKLYQDFNIGFQAVADSNIRYLIDKQKISPVNHQPLTDGFVREYCSPAVADQYFKIIE